VHFLANARPRALPMLIWIRRKWARVFVALQMIVVVVAAARSNIGSMVCPDKLKDVARGILDGAHSPSESLY